MDGWVGFTLSASNSGQEPTGSRARDTCGSPNDMISGSVYWLVGWLVS